MLNWTVKETHKYAMRAMVKILGSDRSMPCVRTINQVPVCFMSARGLNLMAQSSISTSKSHMTV